MNNQWGRNTQTPRGGSPAGFLLAAVLCLVLIGAGVYGWFVRENLRSEIADLTASNSELSAKLAKAEADRKGLSDDIDALKRNAGQWAGKLEQDYADLQLNEVPKLNRLLDKRDATIAALEKQLDTMKANAAADKTRLETDLHAATAEAEGGRQTIGDLRSEAEKLAGELEQLKAQSGDFDDVRSRTETLLKTAQSEASAAKSKLADLNQHVLELEKALSAEKTRAAALERQLAALSTPAADQSSEQPQADTQTPIDNARKPRDDAEIAALLAAQRGLGRLDDAKRRRLQDELASGACVTDALESVFDKVPLVVMRDLMRKLKSDC